MDGVARMVFLGFGKYARADRIYAVEPITGDERGGGRRTRVWVEGIAEPLIASRTERTILHEWVTSPPAASSSTRRSPSRSALPRPRRRAASTSPTSGGAHASSSRRAPPAEALLSLPRGFFARPVAEVGRDLVGATLLVDGVGGRIVELELYDHEDPASHGYRGKTERNASMFGPPGHAYVYRSYGIHWCLNLVCAEEGVAAAVLVRALEPTRGVETMRARRGLEDDRLLCAGPGRLCQALGVTRAHDGLPLDAPPFALHPATTEPAIAAAPRIGISRAAELPWRLCDSGSRYLSRPLPRSAAASRASPRRG